MRQLITTIYSSIGSMSRNNYTSLNLKRRFVYKSETDKRKYYHNINYGNCTVLTNTDVICCCISISCIRPVTRVMEMMCNVYLLRTL